MHSFCWLFNWCSINSDLSRSKLNRWRAIIRFIRLLFSVWYHGHSVARRHLRLGHLLWCAINNSNFSLCLVIQVICYITSSTTDLLSLERISKYLITKPTERCAQSHCGLCIFMQEFLNKQV